MSIEYTDDPHPRNAYWELWGLPVFDTQGGGLREHPARGSRRREAFPEHYIKLIAYDPTRGRQTTALAFIVNRPTVEKRFILDRIQGPGPRRPLPARPDERDGGQRLGERSGRRVSFEFGMRPPQGCITAAAEPEEYDVDEEEADADRRSTRRPRCGAHATNVLEVLDQLDRELIALAPVKTRIREIAALLLIDRLRAEVGLASRAPVAAHVVHGQPRDRARRRSR